VIRRALPALVAVLSGCAAGPRPPPAEHLALRQRSSGSIARGFDDPRTAAVFFGRAARTAAQGDRAGLAADAACREGLARIAAGDAASAIEPLERAAAQAEGAGDPALAARAWLGLARARQALGQDGVAGALERAGALARAGADPVAAALAELGLGALASPEEAPRRFDEAGRLAGADPAVAGPLALNRARRAERAGQPAAALALYRAALEPLARSDDRPALYLALSSAARLADEAGERAAGADLRRRAEAVARGLGPTFQAGAE
jgi:tetratricopeptide (TPR) repeat protein